MDDGSRTRPKKDSNNGSVDETSKSPVIFGGNCDFISKIAHCLIKLTWTRYDQGERELLFGGE